MKKPNLMSVLGIGAGLLTMLNNSIESYPLTENLNTTHWNPSFPLETDYSSGYQVGVTPVTNVESKNVPSLTKRHNFIPFEKMDDLINAIKPGNESKTAGARTR